MFIVIYEFEVKEGREPAFREAWLELTRLIYRQAGSLGSRLHHTNTPGLMLGYAQWPSREHWRQAGTLNGPDAARARQRMGGCLLGSRVLHELEVAEDFLQSRAFAGGEMK